MSELKFKNFRNDEKTDDLSVFGDKSVTNCEYFW